MAEDWVAVATTKDLARRRKLRVEVDGVVVTAASSCAPSAFTPS